MPSSPISGSYLDCLQSSGLVLSRSVTTHACACGAGLWSMPIQCKRCGAEAAAGESFCRECGAPIGVEQEKPRPRTTSHTLAAIALIVGSVTLLLGGTCAGFFGVIMFGYASERRSPDAQA